MARLDLKDVMLFNVAQMQASVLEFKQVDAKIFRSSKFWG